MLKGILDIQVRGYRIIRALPAGERRGELRIEGLLALNRVPPQYRRQVMGTEAPPAPTQEADE